VPVKASSLKSRLTGVLSASQRKEFAKLLLVELLGVLADAGLLGSTFVVSPDGEALRTATKLGAGGIREEKDRGVNSAVFKGISESGSPDVVLVLPSDLPLLRASEVKAVLRLKSSGFDVVVSPSRGFTGTNALAYSPSSGLVLSYDDDSFWNHLASAARRGLTTAVSSRFGIMFDIDSPEDFRALAKFSIQRESVEFARRNSR